VLVACAKPSFTPEHLAQLPLGSVDWPALLALADDHGMLPLLAARIGECGDGGAVPEVRAKLLGTRRAQTIFTLGFTAELFRLLAHFAAAGIEVLLTKGPALAMRCYGDPGLRQYSDLDLIVRDRDMRRAAAAMIALGYESKVPLAAIDAGKAPGEYVFTQCGTKLLVEFHTERTFRYHPRPLPAEKLFPRQGRVNLDGRDVPVLSLEDELLLNCIHGAKHFWERLMWVADVGALISRQKIDWSRAVAVAREVDAERMLHLGLLLGAEVLGIEVPASAAPAAQADSAAVRFTQQIAERLPTAPSEGLGLAQRAAFRMRMRGGLFQGAAYLLRLSFSPTEEDWGDGAEEKRSWLVEAMGRPFRLARKYGREAR
jgi:hypothetical protein